MRQIHLTVLAAAAALALSACASSSTMAPTDTNPGSQGKIAAREGPNGNTKLEVRLDHLAEPRAIDPAFETYVVWIKPANGDSYVNAGQVAINAERQGMLETTTPHETFTVMVTAEARATGTSPRGPVILQGDVTERSPDMWNQLRTKPK